MTRSQLVLLVVLGLQSGSAAHAQSLLARLNAGGPTVTDDLGQVWNADQAYARGAAATSRGTRCRCSRSSGRS
jgi:hypothetical protein